MDSVRVILVVFCVFVSSIFPHNSIPVRAQSSPLTSSCYTITNGQRFLHPSNAVDPNRGYWQFAALTLNGTAATTWKLLPTLDSCFRLCNPQTGLFLMVVVETDLSYAVQSSLMQHYPRESFIFGPHYPQWPAALDALITSTLRLYQLCASLDADPNEERLVAAYPQQTAAARPTECRWRLDAVACPRHDRC